MKKLLVLAATVTGAVLLAAAPASAVARVCYDAQVNLNGEPVVAESACHLLP